MRTPSALLLSIVLAMTIVVAACGDSSPEDQPSSEEPQQEQETSAIQVHDLEIVTPDVDGTCEALEKLHGVTFGPPDAALGNARTATLKGEGKVGVRAPMRDDEEPVVRPYLLTEDIEAAVGAAQASGAVIAVPPMGLPGHGRCAIFLQGGVEHGLWQR